MTSNRATNTSTVVVQCPSGTAPGDAVVIGKLKGVAEAVFDSDMKSVAVTTDANGYATLRIAPSTIVNIEVNASDDVDTSPLSSPSAVALGDQLYVEAGSEVVSKDTDDVAFGIALGVKSATTGGYATGNHLDAGEVGNIDVLLGAN